MIIYLFFNLRLTINLLNGDTDKEDIALHLNVRFEDNVIVRNSKIGDSWGNEEREGGVPFDKGHIYEIIILVTRTHLKIAINGFYYTSYNYRSPVERIKRLHIAGDTSLNLVRVLQTKFGEGEFSGENWLVAPPPVLNPKVPYHAPIGIGKLMDGSGIFIQGFAHKNAKNININLKSGYDKDDDIPFHYNLRFGEDVMVINSYDNKSWGKEERVKHFPFQKGQMFELFYFLEGDHYRVSINGKPVFEFRHRINPEGVRVLAIEGDLDLINVWFKPPLPGRYQNDIHSYFVDCCGFCCGTYKIPEQYGIKTDAMSSVTPPNFNPPTPFSLFIPGGLKEGRIIIVSGDGTLLGKTWSLNLQTDRAVEGKPLPDVGFHMNVRYGDKMVVRNTRQAGKWMVEEANTPFFPFEKGTFELVIFCMDKAFAIAVNGQHFWDFRYRLYPNDKIDTLVVEGDVKIKHVCIC
ncbi:unnamed protein product [Gordionus sp. m RMFG-2023]